MLHLLLIIIIVLFQVLTNLSLSYHSILSCSKLITLKSLDFSLNLHLISLKIHLISKIIKLYIIYTYICLQGSQIILFISQ